MIGSVALTPVCVILGVATVGVGAIGCGIVVAAVGGYAGGLGGDMAGEHFGELIYEWRP